MARHFDGDATGKAALISLRNHFLSIEKRMALLRNQSDYGRTAADDLCNQQNAVIRVAVRAKTRTLGFGTFKSMCITELESDSNHKLYGTIETFQKSVLEAGTRVLKSSTANWKRVYTHSRFSYNGPINRCSLYHLVGFRIQGKWSVLGSVTQHPVNIRKEDRKRRYFEEFLQPGNTAGDRIRNLRMTLPLVENKNVIVNDSSTSISTWGGIPASSIFQETVPLDKNPGISAALVYGRRWKQQAEDSQTTSNIAIMVLSLSLALVPIALFADVSRTVAISYAIVTDIVSCMPLFIKGIELIQHSRISLRATRTWVYGMETNVDIAIAETWTARCQSHSSLFVTGATFISVAVLAMATGVTLEILTRKKLHRSKQALIVSTLASENAILKQLWAQEAPCENCACYAVRMERKEGEKVVKPLGSTGILSTKLNERMSRSR